MPKTIETTVFTFDELTETSKERARAWFREGLEFEADLEPIETAAGLLGVEFRDHKVPLMGGKFRSEPDIFWEVGGHHYGGASFTGRYAYVKGNPDRKITAEFPQDIELQGIANRLQTLQARMFYQVTATVTAKPRSGHSLSVEVYNRGVDASPEVSVEVEDILKRFATWIYDQAQADYAYRMSDEAVGEDILANEYTFTENGKREG
jgi:hypothetical protein